MAAKARKHELEQILAKATPFYFDGNREIIIAERQFAPVLQT